MVLCATFIAWEELHSTSLAHRQRNYVVLNPAILLEEPTPCSVHYSSDRRLNNEDICRRPLQFQQTSQQLQMSVNVHSSSHEHWSQGSVSVYQAQHVYACVSLVMNINCHISIILPPVHTFCRFMYPFKYQHASSLNRISSLHKIQFDDPYRFRVVFVQNECCVAMFVLHSSSCRLSHLLSAWQAQPHCIHLHLKCSDCLLLVSLQYGLNSTSRMLATCRSVGMKKVKGVP